MTDPGYFAMFVVGLLGGGHCAGMCGGIVAALSGGTQPGARAWGLHLGYNGGRILSYVIAGTLAGALAGLGRTLVPLASAQLALYLLANLMLVALGAYLLGFTRSLQFVERSGQRLWRHIQPMTARFLPVRSLAQAVPLGMLWGWLPCGLVYSALATALASASASRGAAIMLAFGLGTLPNLLLAGVLVTRFRRAVQAPAVRIVSGLLVIGFGVYGLLRTGEFAATLWQTAGVGG